MSDRDWPDGCLNVRAECIGRNCGDCHDPGLTEWSAWNKTATAMQRAAMATMPSPSLCSSLSLYAMARMAHRLRGTADVLDRCMACLVEDPELRGALIAEACEGLPDVDPRP
jgi:hypothetical protein